MFCLGLLGSADVSNSLRVLYRGCIACLGLLESDGVCLKLLRSA